jgi:hypothetical protein
MYYPIMSSPISDRIRSLGMTLGDYILIGALMTLGGTFFFLTPRWVVSTGTVVHISQDNRLFARYPLEADRDVAVPGPLGPTSVRIRRGRVFIQASPCSHKVCSMMGEIGKEGGIIVCIPNRVVVSIGSGVPHGLDAVSR